MKANAPEKIYVHIKDKPCEITFSEVIEKECSNIEYARTDAFIKKASEFFGEHLWEYIDVKNANCDTFINIDGDKLEEDFKNYMKGE